MSEQLDLLFLGSGNAFAAEGRAFSSCLLNGRYLFDCGPTILQQLRKAGLSSDDIDVVFISHFHSDHFFGLPFLFLDAKYRTGRTKDILIVGPPGIAAQTEQLLRLGYPTLSAEAPSEFRRRYVEVADGFEADVAGLAVTAATVEHVAELECFAYRVRAGNRSLVYSGDTTRCEGLLRLVSDADVVVLECCCDGVPVHLSPADIEAVAGDAPPHTRFVLTHLDGHQSSDPLLQHLIQETRFHVASDLARFQF
jgi:ribonuclease BN (tRNA processing enzyme)